MARRLGKRKQPDRDDYMLHEQMKIEDRVFDNRTMMALSKVFTHKIVARLNFMLTSGKEADIYLADPGARTMNQDAIVLKIFRIETSSFTSRINYIYGDPRFEKTKTNAMSIVNTWCKKEYGNLSLAIASGAHAPKPYYFIKNILAMEYINNDGKPAGNLRDSPLDDPDKTLDLIIEDLKKLYSVELIHSDISEYNILMKGDIPYLIDFGQAVVLRHPHSMDFLKRDIKNLLIFFKKRYGIKRDEAEVLAYIIKEAEESK